MARTALNDFLLGAGSALTGTLSGQAAGQQAALQRQQQQQEMDRQRQAAELQQFQAYSNIYQQQREQAMEPYRIGQQNLPLLDPQSRAKVIAEGFKVAGSQPNPYDATALSTFLKTHQMPTVPPTAPSYEMPTPPPTVQQAAAWGAPGVAPQAPQQPAFVFDQSGAAAGGLPITPTAATTPGAVTAAGAPAAPAAPVPPAETAPTVTTPFGNLTLNAVPKERQTRIGKSYEDLQRALVKLPASDAGRLAAQQALSTPGFTLFPQTQEEAAAIERILQQALSTVGGTDNAQTRIAAGNIKDTARNIRDLWPTLRTESPENQLQGMLDLDEQATAVEKQAKENGLTVVLPAGWAAERKPIAEIRRLVAKGDAESLAEAQKISGELIGRISSPLTNSQMNTRMNTVLAAIGKHDPFDPKFDEWTAKLVHDNGLESQFPDSGKGMSGSARQKVWQQWQTRMLAVADKDSKTQRFVLNQGRSIARMMGMDPSQIPTEISKTLTPSQQIDLRKLQRATITEYQNDQRFNLSMQEGQARMTKLRQSGSAGGAVRLRELMGNYRVIHQRLKDLQTQEGFTSDDLAISKDGKQVGTYLKPDTWREARKLTSQEQAAAAAVNSFVNRPQDAAATSGAPQQTATAGGQKPRMTRAQAADYIRKQIPGIRPEALTATLNSQGY